MELSKLEQIIGYEFRDKQLLQRAVTHSSYANEKLGSPGEGNERLEFLGDAVLGACVGLQLYNRYTDKEEGYLTKMRASIVCERSLGNAGKKLGVNEFLLLSRGEESGGGRDRGRGTGLCGSGGRAARRGDRPGGSETGIPASGTGAAGISFEGNGTRRSVGRRDPLPAVGGRRHGVAAARRVQALPER